LLEFKKMIRKSFTKLNNFLQFGLQFFAEKFDKPITEIIFLFLLTCVPFLSLIRFNNTSPLLGLAISIASIFLLFYAFRKLVSHNSKIRKMQQKHNKFTKLPATKTRIISVIVFFIISIILFWLVDINPYKWETLKQITIGEKSIISLITLIITAPIVFIIWIFRDKNKLLELENARKDTNLKEFQQLQRWATGNIDGDNESNKVALQISALHSLRAYLKGEYGESFRRGAYEIFRVILATHLATQHQKVLEIASKNEYSGIANIIDNFQLAKQLNTIVSEEWFNLLINHDFPTKDISLVGVDLSCAYLHHRTYGKTFDLQGAQLQRVNLSKAQLQEVDLSNAQLQGANLKCVKLQGANLINAQLQGVDLEDAQLQGANLEGAQLQGANLKGVRLQRTNLKGAQLQGAYLSSHDYLNFEERIMQQVGQNTDIEALKSQHLTQLGTSEALNLSKATTGKYSQKEAEKWLNTYKEVVKDDDF